MEKIIDLKTEIESIRESLSGKITETVFLSVVRKVKNLMKKYDLTVDDLREMTEKTKSFDRAYVGGGKQLHPVDQYVTAAIGEFTDTKASLNFFGRVSTETSGRGRGKGSRNRVYRTEFFGYSVDVEIARFLYELCKEAMETESAQYIRENKKPDVHGKEIRKEIMQVIGRRISRKLSRLKTKMVNEWEGGEFLFTTKMQNVNDAFREVSTKVLN